MKKSILLLAALVFSVGSIMAQDKIVDSDYCIFQDGEVLQYVDGKPSKIANAVTLKDGTKVNANGSYLHKNKTMQLQDGQCLGMSGKMYKSEEQLFVAVQKQKKKFLKKAKN